MILHQDLASLEDVQDHNICEADVRAVSNISADHNSRSSNLTTLVLQYCINVSDCIAFLLLTKLGFQ